MTKNAIKEKKEVITFNMKKSLIEDVYQVVRKKNPYKQVHYYTQAVRLVLIEYLEDNAELLKKLKKTTFLEGK